VILNKEKFIEEGVPGQRLADFEGRRIFLQANPSTGLNVTTSAGIESGTDSPAERWRNKNFVLWRIEIVQRSFKQS